MPQDLNKDMKSSIATFLIGVPYNPGKVLRIGWFREKTVATKPGGASRDGAKTIIFPADNTSDWLELPELCRFGMGKGEALARQPVSRLWKWPSMHCLFEYYEIIFGWHA